MLYIKWFKEISKKDISLVGGKNGSLGEMFSNLTKRGIAIPDGFCLTSKAYWYFLKENKIDQKLNKIFQKYNPKSIKSLQKASRQARNLILMADFPEDLKEEVVASYLTLSENYKSNASDVAVRSSATAEDLPTASFAGQHETYLNVRGKYELLSAIKKCLASLFTARAIAYRDEKGFKHMEIALSVAVQKMVRSDLASSGIMFTIDTETGFQNVILINSIFGIGEMIVKGKITPDEFYVFKPSLKKMGRNKKLKPIVVKNLGRKNKKYIYSKNGGLKEVVVPKEDSLKFSLTENEILTLARWALKIEEYYESPQDIEWAKDGQTGKLFIVQSRPETIHTTEDKLIFKEYQVKTSKKPILTGIAIGNKIGTGKANVIESVSKIAKFNKGEVLCTRMTDPDWVPAMAMAAGIVTEEGGKTCHAAIIARELGIPCVVGVKNGLSKIKQKEDLTVDCTTGALGKVFRGKIPHSVKEYHLKKDYHLKTKIMLNLATTDTAFACSFLPNAGVGLAREEFIIAEKIKAHPLALCHFEKIKKQSLEIKSKKQKKYIEGIIKKIDAITVEHLDKREYFIKELAEGIGQIASAFWPKPVIVRLSDFKTNEYKTLLGGELFEPEEENPMLGYRGASRYYSPEFLPAFKMELQAIRRVREVFGLDNVKIMVPFCRTPEEGKKVLKIIKEAGLKRGQGLKIYVMCEIPSNVLLANEFLNIFDGMSIGSNDLTQLIMGIDRDNGTLQHIANEKNPAVKKMLHEVIAICKKRKKYCGICGQAPSDYPEFAKWLIKEGIESISLNPDSVIKTILALK
ncbi:phosphoenolpyruvate synthase [bacterium (Candidatus Gribaldobacteria) CG10_big_fil_rev_8_21_14_0_10_37_21]|uniref:Phosphoenolpyruvate synthase n=1 Tax=bacterium (Candidatus Gribaldobacteria) CG10_big_fil_rev_8_21_14_0_10_37_21 TaxID=2014275 RepID=A0A2H0UV43_9BACT|nr:MAG: phosphoenolpyruvate synthase [bacterium (Candidatus Gribaldobacteria) CG10_big_fil_rev_8_21_14_0_10_37_21]